MTERKELDYSRSSGSKGHGGDYDHDRPVEHDGRSGMHTTFNPSEAVDQDRFEELRRCHERVEQLSGNERRQAERRRFADTVTAFFDLPSHQRERVRYMVERIDFDQFSGVGYEVAILALVTLVQNRHADAFEDILQRRDEYEEYLESIDASQRGVRQCRKKIRPTLHDID